MLDSSASSLDVDPHDEPLAVRRGRHFVEQRVAALGAHALIDDAALVAAELLANAAQHGSAPVELLVSGDSRHVRIAVRDAERRLPVRSVHSTSNMTGRGLALVEAVSVRWGVEPEPGGKVVWADLGDVAPAEQSRLGDAPELDAERSRPGHTVVLGDVPTDLLIAAKAHIDNLVREFSLAAAGAGDDAPQDLVQVIETVVHGFSEARDAVKRQALAAAQAGQRRTELTLHLPLSAAEAGLAYLRALDEADAYAKAARLLTLDTPPAHRLFRQWYVHAVVRQLRQVAEGSVPDPVVPFEAHLLAEVERLAVLHRQSDGSARLQRVSAALSQTRSPQDVADVVLVEGVAALGASGGGLLVVAEDGEHLAVPGAVGYGIELVHALRDERLDAPLPAATALRTGEPVWLESRTERDRRFPALAGLEAATVSMCAVPMVVGGRTLGALRFSFATRRLFDEDERAFVLSLAAQTAQTLVRTEVDAIERQVSRDLQRALLPDTVPAIAGWDVAALCRPAGDEEAGGDFFDVLPLADGRFVALVGDVMGRGVSAAAAMAQVRTALRAYAIDDPDPRSVFARVDAFFEVSGFSQLVTVLFLLVDPASGEVELGNAGHLPPLLVDAQGSHLVVTAIGTPFGVGGLPRESTSMRLVPDASLVVITDGLVERRHEDIDVGIERVRTALADAPRDSTADELLKVALRGAGDIDHDDDVTVLVLSRQQLSSPPS